MKVGFVPVDIEIALKLHEDEIVRMLVKKPISEDRVSSAIQVIKKNIQAVET